MLKVKKEVFIFLFILLCSIALPGTPVSIFANEKINWDTLNEEWDNMAQWDWVHKTGNIFEINPKGQLHIYGEDKTDYSVLRLKNAPVLPENYTIEVRIKCIRLAESPKEGHIGLDIIGKKVRTNISFQKDALYYYFRKSAFGTPALNQWQVWRFVVGKESVNVFCDGKPLGVWQTSKAEGEKETIQITAKNVEVYLDYLRIGSGITETAETKQVINIDDATKNNLVKNGDFEEDADKDGIPDNWFPGNFSKYFSLDAINKSSGIKSWKVVGGGASVYASSREIPVIPSQSYTLIFDIRQEDIPIGFKQGGFVEIRWNKQGSEYSFQGLGLIEGNFDWQRETYVVEAPEGARSAVIYLEKRGSCGETWYDNVIFTPGILKIKKESNLKDRAKEYIVFENLLRDLRQFIVFKEPFLSRPLMNTYEKIAGSIGNFLKEIKSEPENGLTLEEYLKEHTREIDFQEMLKGKLAFQPSLSEAYYDDWKKFSSEVKEFKNEVAEFLEENQPEKNKAAIKAVFGVNSSYGVGVTSNLQKVLKDRPYCGPITDKAKISLARGEHEGFQIVLIPLQEDLKDVQVILKDLRASNGETIESQHIKAFPVGYVKTDEPDYNIDYVGWLPDPLLIDKTFSVKKGENQPVWIDIYIPENKKPGTYTGEIIISPTNSQPLRVKLEVKVWDYIIPKKGHFKVLGRFRPDKLAKFYKWDAVPEDILLKWYLFLVEHRWSPTDIFSSSMQPDGEILRECINEGLNIVNISNISKLLPYDRDARKYSLPDEKTKKEIASILKEQVMVLKKYNALDIGYIFCFDEQHDSSQYPLMREVLTFIKSVVPEVKISTTTTYPPLKELVGAVDTWVPLLGSASKELEERQKAGDELFFYIYGHPYHPFPNASLIDYPSLDARISFWIAAEKGWTGFLHWYVNGWEVNFAGDKRWPEIPWKPYAYPNHKGRNGEGYFIYPGPNGEPLSSIRFENIRDGIEDWESIYILKDLIKKINNEKERKVAEGILDEVKQLVPNEYNYELNPEKLLFLREKIGEEIEKLRHIINDERI